MVQRQNLPALLSNCFLRANSSTGFAKLLHGDKPVTLGGGLTLAVGLTYKAQPPSVFINPKTLKKQALGTYITFMPGVAPLSGESRKIVSPPGPAAKIIPSETPNRIFRGARFATITVRRPSSSSAL